MNKLTRYAVEIAIGLMFLAMIVAGLALDDSPTWFEIEHGRIERAYLGDNDGPH